MEVDSTRRTIRALRFGSGSSFGAMALVAELATSGASRVPLAAGAAAAWPESDPPRKIRSITARLVEAVHSLFPHQAAKRAELTSSSTAVASSWPGSGAPVDGPRRRPNGRFRPTPVKP